MDQDVLEERLKWWAITALFVIFNALLCVWNTAGLTARACRDGDEPAEKRLRNCSISMTVGAWTHISKTERVKGAIVDLERGIALFDLGRLDEAKDAFALARRNASQGGRFAARLDARIEALGDPDALALWQSVTAGR